MQNFEDKFVSNLSKLSAKIEDNGIINFTYGANKENKTLENYILDYDCAVTNKEISNKSDVVDYVNEFHKIIKNFFENSITDNLRNLLNK